MLFTVKNDRGMNTDSIHNQEGQKDEYRPCPQLGKTERLIWVLSTSKQHIGMDTDALHSQEAHRDGYGCCPQPRRTGDGYGCCPQPGSTEGLIWALPTARKDRGMNKDSIHSQEGQKDEYGSCPQPGRTDRWIWFLFTVPFLCSVGPKSMEWFHLHVRCVPLPQLI